jgi:anaerobic selenocysteine-containing dehydrogenase
MSDQDTQPNRREVLRAAVGASLAGSGLPLLDATQTPAGHGALPIFYTHPEVTRRNPSIEYLPELVTNPVNPQASTPRVRLGGLSAGAVHRDFTLMGMIGRPSVLHFAGVTQWMWTGKQMNGVRLVQIHSRVAARERIANGDTVIVESPRGSVRGTALLWPGIREDTIFVPSTFGPMQKLAEEFGLPLYESANVLTDDRCFDNLSGQQAYKCFACRLRRVDA